MGFADELKNAPMEKADREYEEKKKIMENYVNFLYDDFKDRCKSIAENNGNNIHYSSDDYYSRYYEEDEEHDVFFNAFGKYLKEEVWNEIIPYVRKKLEDDGFNNIKLRISEQKAITHTEYETVKYSSGEKKYWDF